MSIHPRVERLLGLPRKLNAPRRAKRWVIKKTSRSQNEDVCTVEGNDGQINQNEVATENETTSSGNAHPEENAGFSSDFSISSSEDDHED